jgi:uncharacterized protein YbbK (DUF523 family)
MSRKRLRLGVSQCLLGASVRYDGGHQRDHFVTERLAPLVEWVPVCPENDAGMGTPRPPIELRGDPASPSIHEVESDRDLTGSFGPWCHERARQLLDSGLDGFVLKSESPSCGLHEVPVHDGDEIRGMGHGLFARALLELDPTLPCCREGDLLDEERRRAFFLRATSRHRWRNREDSGRSTDSQAGTVAEGLLDPHRLALLARGFDWQEARRRWRGATDLETAQHWLAHALARPESDEGQIRALELAITWLERLDARHWLAFAPMLAEIRSGSMRPQVLRVTLQLIAHAHSSPLLREQSYFEPWGNLEPGPAASVAES